MVNQSAKNDLLVYYCCAQLIYYWCQGKDHYHNMFEITKRSNWKCIIIM